MTGSPIPSFINPSSGGADEIKAALTDTSRFEVHEVEPDKLSDSVREAVAAGARRVLVAGGDGTVASAASAVAGSGVELAVLPGGTLNHFARDNGIPPNIKEAAEVAQGTSTRTADVGYVNDRIFLNTSSVGLYVTFVLLRERLESYFGYRLASFIAAIRVFLSARNFTVSLEIDDQKRTYRTPLVFISVGERELKLPTLGGRVEGGRRGLHVLVVSGRTRAGLAVLAFEAAARGVKDVSRTPHLDSFMVNSCTIQMRRPFGRVAVDGEIVEVQAPLEYSLRLDALKIVAPAKAWSSLGRLHVALGPPVDEHPGLLPGYGGAKELGSAQHFPD